MKIHSSSLAFYPSGINPLQTGKSSSAGEQKVIEKAKGDKSRLNEGVLTPEQLEKEFGQIRPVNLISHIDNPVNVHTQKALNAYTDTVNQPLHEQRAQITGIDFYV